jgi:hypothetical protein
MKFEYVMSGGEDVASNYQKGRNRGISCILWTGERPKAAESDSPREGSYPASRRYRSYNIVQLVPMIPPHLDSMPQVTQLLTLISFRSLNPECSEG